MIFGFLGSGFGGLELVAIILAYLIAILFALSFHEFAHAFTAHKCGDDTAKLLGRLTINPFAHIDGLGMLSFLFVGFGWAKPVPVDPLKFRSFKKSMFWVSVSGILTNLIIAFFSAFFMILTRRIADQNLFFNFLFMLFTFSTQINVALAIFNILPIYPLDGFNSIATFLKYDNKFVLFMRQYGQIILLIVIVTGLFSLVLAPVLNGCLWVFDWFWGLIL